MPHKENTHLTQPVENLHDAYLIDEHGNEIPITRPMIESSCENLSPSNTDKA